MESKEMSQEGKDKFMSRMRKEYDIAVSHYKSFIERVSECDLTSREKYRGTRHFPAGIFETYETALDTHSYIESVIDYPGNRESMGEENFKTLNKMNSRLYDLKMDAGRAGLNVTQICECKKK